MPYAVKQDLIDRFGEDELIQLTDRSASPVAIDDTVLGKALSDADGVIDAHLAGRYTLPLASVPKLLVRYAADIARYFLYEDRAGESVRRAYEDALAFLKRVSEGKASLGLDASNAAVSPSSGGVEFNESRRDFADRRY